MESQTDTTLSTSYGFAHTFFYHTLQHTPFNHQLLWSGTFALRDIHTSQSQQVITCVVVAVEKFSYSYNPDLKCAPRKPILVPFLTFDLSNHGYLKAEASEEWVDKRIKGYMICRKVKGISNVT